MNDYLLPPYTAPYKPVPQVQPFSYRDSVTMLGKLEGLTRYINNKLVPWVNENFSELADAFENQVNGLITAVNAAIQQIVDDSIEVQDPVVAGLLADEASATYAALTTILADYYTSDYIDENFTTQDSAEAAYNALWVAVNNTFTQEEATNLFETKTDATAKNSAMDARVDIIEALIASGYLAQANLDARYVLKDVTASHAVFIGSSNSQAGTWPETLCTRQGWVCHNYSIGGGGYGGTGPEQFIAQLSTAIADTSYSKADVDYVFITDASNDVRGGRRIYDNANSLYSAAKSTYPNARVIVVPIVWTYTQINVENDDRVFNVSKCAAEMRTAAIHNGVEFCEESWLWLWDSVEAWASSPTLNTGVHPTANGYTRIIKYIEQHLIGNTVQTQIGLTDMTPIVSESLAAVWSVRAKRIGSNIHIIGSFDTYADIAINVDLGEFPIGLGAINEVQLTAVNSDRTDFYLSYFRDGTLRTMTALPGGKKYFVYATIQAL